MSRHRTAAGPSVLVTGGAGFLGSRLVSELALRGARVVVADDLSAGRAERLPRSPRVRFHPLDVGAPGALVALVGEEGPPDVIVHLAARVGVERVLADPEGCRREHLAAARELAALLGSGSGAAPWVIAASTSEVYDESRCAPGPVREDAPLRPLDGRGRFAYAASKRAVEERLDAAHRAAGRGPAPLHLRLFNVVGPGQDAASGMVLPRFVEAARAGRPLAVHGDGGQVRTFAHVDDVAADLARLALGDGRPAGPLNLGGTARATVLELAHTVLAAVPEAAGIVHVDPRERLGAHFAEVRRREPDLGRARSVGLARRTRDLRAIVADTLRRHPRRGAESTEPRRPACASRGS